MEDDVEAFPLFKGATRIPTTFGVPVIPLLIGFGAVAMITMWISLWCWFLLIPVIVIMRAITKHDDRRFSIWFLWFDTKWRNRFKKFWAASSYCPIRYRDRH